MTPDIASIARTTKVIAVVGLSPRADRPSFGVSRYLQNAGFRIIPVNPGHDGQSILGETCYADLASIPADIPVDMVDIFRRSEAVPPVVDDALAHLPQLRTIWMQLGVINEVAAQKARDAGIAVVQDRCPAIEFPAIIGR